MSGAIEARLHALGIVLPSPGTPGGTYVPFTLAGNLLFISGQISRRPDGSVLAGRLGADLAVADGQAAARICALSILSHAQAALGSLDRVARILKLTGFVNATPEFAQQPAVINGASDLLVEIFGDRGRHARSAVGMASLPSGAAVEIEAVIAVTT